MHADSVSIAPSAHLEKTRARVLIDVTFVLMARPCWNGVSKKAIAERCQVHTVAAVRHTGYVQAIRPTSRYLTGFMPLASSPTRPGSQHLHPFHLTATVLAVAGQHGCQ